MVKDNGKRRVADPREAAAIRREFLAGHLNVRAWADLLDCSLETVRRIARGDTYRAVQKQAEQDGFVGVPGSGLIVQGSEPTEEELEASLAQLEKRTPVLVETGAGVNKLLDDMVKKGRDDGKEE